MMDKELHRCLHLRAVNTSVSRGRSVMKAVLQGSVKVSVLFNILISVKVINVNLISDSSSDYRGSVEVWRHFPPWLGRDFL